MYIKNLKREVRFLLVPLNCMFSNTRSSSEVHEHCATEVSLGELSIYLWSFPVQSLFGHQTPYNNFDHKVGTYLLIYFLTCQNQWSRRGFLFLSEEFFTLQLVCVFLQGMENLHSKSDGVENELSIALEMLLIYLAGGELIDSFSMISVPFL